MFEKKYGLGSFKGVLVAYLVLILHVILVAIIGILVMFFGGIVNYISVIFLFGILIILIMALYAYKKIKKNNMKIMKKLGRETNLESYPLEVSLFGGLASFKLKSSKLTSYEVHQDVITTQIPLLNSKAQSIVKLANLLDRNLITIDEYNEAKRGLLNP